MATAAAAPPPASGGGEALELQVTTERVEEVERQDFTSYRRQPLELAWRNVEYAVTVRDKGSGVSARKPLLRGLSGRAHPGQLLAIMGASGAGKTTFLDVLAARKTRGPGIEYSGEVEINGLPISSKLLRSFVAYVPQMDVVMETLTPREALLFAARMKLPRRMPDGEKQQRVENIIRELALSKCADTVIGGGIVAGISGGERKRVSIGMELITEPSILLLDEPTTGLDSFTSLAVVEKLRDLAAAGRTVVCTIHQPSSDIFALFDRLMLLVEGREVFMGRAARALDFFAQLGRPCPEFTNPADHFMAIMQRDLRGDAKQLEEAVAANARRLAGAARGDAEDDEGEEGAAGGGEQKRESSSAAGVAKLTAPEISDHDRLGFVAQAALLSRRAFLNVLRNPFTAKIRFGQTIFLGLLIGLIFIRLGNDLGSLQSRSGALFFLSINQVMMSMMPVLLTFPAERALFLRETSSGMYATGPYFVSKSVVEMPVQTLFPVVFCCIVYWLIGLQNSATHFFIFVAAMTLGAHVGVSMGLLLSAASPTAETALSLAPLFIMPFVLFSGFAINLESIPPYFNYTLRYLSVFHYVFQIFAINEYDDFVVECSPAELANNFNRCPFNTGRDVLASLNIERDNMGLWFGILVVLWIGLRIVGFFALKLQLRRTRDLMGA